MASNRKVEENWEGFLSSFCFDVSHSATQQDPESSTVDITVGPRHVTCGGPCYQARIFGTRHHRHHQREIFLVLSGFQETLIFTVFCVSHL